MLARGELVEPLIIGAEEPPVFLAGDVLFYLTGNLSKAWKPFYYVRHNGGELYRIMPETLTVDESGSVAYQCEHVLATLIDNILFTVSPSQTIGTLSRSRAISTR